MLQHIRTHRVCQAGIIQPFRSEPGTEGPTCLLLPTALPPKRQDPDVNSKALFPSHRPSPGPCSSMLQAHTHPPGSQESEGKTFAWCGQGLPGANNQLNCEVLLICGVYGAACRETETFAHSDKESAAARLGVSASGESPGKVPAAAESGQAGTKPGQDQCGDPCLPGTSGQCSDLTVLLTVQQVTCSPPPHMPSAFPTGSPSFIHSVHGPFFHCAAFSESSPCGRHSAVH